MSAPAPLHFLPRTVREARDLALRWEAARRDYDDWLPVAIIATDLGISPADLRRRALRAEIRMHRAQGVICVDFGDARALLCRHAGCSWRDLICAVAGL